MPSWHSMVQQNKKFLVNGMKGSSATTGEEINPASMFPITSIGSRRNSVCLTNTDLPMNFLNSNTGYTNNSVIIAKHLPI